MYVSVRALCLWVADSPRRVVSAPAHRRLWAGQAEKAARGAGRWDPGLHGALLFVRAVLVPTGFDNRLILTMHVILVVICCSQPPESFDAEASDDPLKHDIYSLAIITWQLWFKARPYGSDSVAAVASHVAGGGRLPLDPAALEGRGGHPVPPRCLLELIAACWHQLAAERPAAMDVFARFEEGAGPAVRSLAADIGAADCDAGYAPSETVAEFLAGAGLDKAYGVALAEHGFNDVETLKDVEILDDDTLATRIGMTKADIRRLRMHINERDPSKTVLNLKEGTGALKKDAGGMLVAAQHGAAAAADAGEKRKCSSEMLSGGEFGAVVPEAPKEEKSKERPPPRDFSRYDDESFMTI